VGSVLIADTHLFFNPLGCKLSVSTCRILMMILNWKLAAMRVLYSIIFLNLNVNIYTFDMNFSPISTDLYYK